MAKHGKTKQEIYDYILSEYTTEDYESFMRNIYSLPCDSDTFGAIAGGVVEEFYHGFGDIDAEFILKNHLTEDLYEILMR